MAANLGFVPHAAKADARVLAVHRGGNAAAQRGLSDAGRADEAEDRLPNRAGGFDLADRKELDDSVLNLGEAVMVGVQNFLDVREFQAVDGGGVPGQGDHRVDVSPRDGVFRCARVHASKSIELTVDFLERGFWQVRFQDSSLEFFQLFAAVVRFAELTLDGLELLAQVVVALGFAELGVDFALNFAREFKDSNFLNEQF